MNGAAGNTSSASSPTRSCYHAWQRAAPRRAERAARRDSLGTEIKDIFVRSKRRYGAPRIHAELKDRGFRISQRTVARLMREKGIRPPRGRRRVPITTDSRHDHAIAPNLLERRFDVAMPDKVWLADISYIPTDEGWLQIPTEVGQGFRFEAGRHSDLMSDTVPI
jgi:transposase InsO family protein